MKRIYKYDFHYYSVPQLVKLPIGAEVLSFDIQDKSFKLWAIVDTEVELEKRVFVLAMTGEEIPWKVKKTYGTRIVQETGIVIHCLELEGVAEGSSPLLANDPEKDDRLNSQNKHSSEPEGTEKV